MEAERRRCSWNCTVPLTLAEPKPWAIRNHSMLARGHAWVPLSSAAWFCFLAFLSLHLFILFCLFTVASHLLFCMFSVVVSSLSLITAPTNLSSPWPVMALTLPHGIFQVQIMLLVALFSCYFHIQSPKRGIMTGPVFLFVTLLRWACRLHPLGSTGMMDEVVSAGRRSQTGQAH